MQNGLYVATSGLLMQQERVDVISNNIANVNTNGFKRDLAIFSDYRPVDPRYPQTLIQKTDYNRGINSSVLLDEITTDFEMGHLKPTENAYDLSLKDPKNFFTVDTPWGIRFTRESEFTLNSDNEIVDHSGFSLLDRNTNAGIVVPPGTQSLVVQNNGTVTADGIAVGVVNVARFEDTSFLKKVGENLFAAVDALPDVPDEPGVLQGYVEASNVDPILEMVRMVEALRGFEMYQKAVQTWDGLNEQAANNIARM
jgi:flagellar basal-body rod protein FlgG